MQETNKDWESETTKTQQGKSDTTNITIRIDCPFDAVLVFKNIPTDLSVEQLDLISNIARKAGKIGTNAVDTVTAITGDPAVPKRTYMKRRAITGETYNEETIRAYSKLVQKGMKPAERMKCLHSVNIPCSNNKEVCNREYYMKNMAKKEGWKIDWKI
jgi:hypothetical protein